MLIYLDRTGVFVQQHYLSSILTLDVSTSLACSEYTDKHVCGTVHKAVVHVNSHS